MTLFNLLILRLKKLHVRAGNSPALPHCFPNPYAYPSWACCYAIYCLFNLFQSFKCALNFLTFYVHQHQCISAYYSILRGIPNLAVAWCQNIISTTPPLWLRLQNKTIPTSQMFFFPSLLYYFHEVICSPALSHLSATNTNNI